MSTGCQLNNAARRYSNYCPLYSQLDIQSSWQPLSRTTPRYFALLDIWSSVAFDLGSLRLSNLYFLVKYRRPFKVYTYILETLKREFSRNIPHRFFLINRLSGIHILFDWVEYVFFRKVIKICLSCYVMKNMYKNHFKIWADKPKAVSYSDLKKISINSQDKRKCFPCINFWDLFL